MENSFQEKHRGPLEERKLYDWENSSEIPRRKSFQNEEAAMFWAFSYGLSQLSCVAHG